MHIYAKVICENIIASIEYSRVPKPSVSGFPQAAGSLPTAHRRAA